MKTRVIEHKIDTTVWYTVQYKNFLFWHTHTNDYGSDIDYYRKEDAIFSADTLKAKVTKRVVYESD